MRKILISLFAMLALTTAASAQSYENTIGLRGIFGTNNYYGAELSFQNWLSERNRMEYDLGINFGEADWVSLAAIYQWHWCIDGGFGCYAGPGAMASLTFDDPQLGIGVGGQLGIDYQFDIPIQISLDIRPMWNFLGYVHGINWGASFGIRYAF